MTALPRVTSRMIGRTAELARLDDSLAHVPVAVIYGMGGLGKSTLARAFAERWPDRVVWVSAGALPSIAAMASDVFRQLGVAHYDLDAGDRERVMSIASVLERHHGLLIVDDLHALDPAVRQLLLAEAARELRDARLIATSRELVAMTVGDVDRLHLRLEPLDQAATADLCVELARLFGPGLPPERVWEASRGNPFLIRQAHVGALQTYHPMDDVAASLIGPPRALAIALALARSALPQAVLATLSPDDAEPALHELTTRLIADRSADRVYAMHDLMREAVLRTVPPDEQRAIRDRLIDALPQLADPLARATELAHQLRAVERFAELAALLEQSGDALSRGGADRFVLHELQALPDDVMTARLRVLRARTLVHWLQVRRAYDALSADCPDTPSARMVLGNIAIWAGAWSHAEAIFRELAASPDTRARAEFGLAWVAVNRGTWTPEIAEQLRQLDVPGPYIESLRLCDALLRDAVTEGLDVALSVVEDVAPAMREPWARLMLPVLLSLILSRAGELEQAERLIAWSESTLTLQRDRVEINNARAVLAIERGERIAQLGSLRQSIRLFDRGGFFAGRAWTRTVLARVLYQLGRRREAAAVLDEVRGLCTSHGTTAYQAGIAAAEREDPLHPAWLEPRAARRDARRDPIRDALRLARQDTEPMPLELPDGPDFALDRACLVLARAVVARRRGQHRIAAQHLRRAVAEAGAGEVDADVIPSLYDALEHPADAASPDTDELIIDRAHHELTSAGRKLSLAARPVLRALLYAFVDHPAHQLSNDDIAEVLWQSAYDPERHASTLKSNVRRLRDAIRELGVEIVREDNAYRLAPRGGVRSIS